MTNTSVNQNSPKPQKPKGFLRTGALVPSLVLMAIIYGYFFFFFDGHLRRGIEFAGTRLYGAQIDVGSVKTSFLHASFRLTDLEVTDKEQPARNLVQVGSIHFAALWDALLRGKVAIEDASILDIRAYTLRKSPGYVAPPPPPDGPGMLAKVQEQVLQQTRKQFNQNFLGDLADIAAGGDPKAQLKEIQGNLKAEAKAKELEKALADKKVEWEKRIKDLPNPKDLQVFQDQIKALNLNTKNPVELAGNLKKAKDIVSQAQAKVKQVQDTQSSLTGDIKTYTDAVGNLDNLVAEDVADLQKRLKLPSIDPKGISEQLFMGQLEKRVVGIRRYIEIARKYMPPKKTKEQLAAEKKAAEDELLPPARGEGKTYHFPITHGYPLFWVKRAAISSEISQSEWAGNVKGEITDLTSSPSELGRPTKLRLDGDFPKQNIHGVKFLAVMDHTTEKAKESIKASVGSFPVANQMFSDSPSARLGLKSAIAAAEMSATLADQSLDIAMGSRFDKPDFEFEAQSAPVKEIIGAVLKGIPTITMNAKVSGSWDHFSIGIDSNLGSELSKGFQKQLSAKLADSQAKLKAMVNDKIGPAKKKVQDALGSLTGGPGKALTQRKDEMDKALKSTQASATGGVGKSGSPAGGLLKGLGF